MRRLGIAPAEDGGDWSGRRDDPPEGQLGGDADPDWPGDEMLGQALAPAGGGPRERPVWAARLVRSGAWGSLAERWVPESLRGARVDPGRRGAVLLSLVAALAAVAAALGVWWDRPQPRPVTPMTSPGLAVLSPSTGAPSGPAGLTGGVSQVSGAAGKPASHATGSPGPASVSGSTGAVPPARSPAAETSPTGPMLVSVTGRVRHPGVVRLPAGSRVADAISAAGGPLDPADLTGLNLAAHLSDGDSVVVAGPAGSSVGPEAGGSVQPSPGPAAPGAVEPAPPVNLNTADPTALDALPGVGPVTAAAIIAWRSEHGPFTSVDQLQAIPGIGPAKFAQIAPHVTVS